MNIAGFQKLTTTDFPGMIACIAFTQGCNFKCPYCHNSELIPVVSTLNKSQQNETDFFDYLEKRKSIVDGVVVTRW